jgi:hypothetical protein
MGHEQFEEHLSGYAVGALDRPERQALEVHLLSGCTDCYAGLKDYYGVAALLPYALPAESPPTDLKQRLLTATEVKGPVVLAARVGQVPASPVSAESPPVKPARVSSPVFAI